MEEINSGLSKEGHSRIVLDYFVYGKGLVTTVEGIRISQN